MASHRSSHVRHSKESKFALSSQCLQRLPNSEHLLPFCLLDSRNGTWTDEPCSHCLGMSLRCFELVRAGFKNYFKNRDRKFSQNLQTRNLTHSVYVCPRDILNSARQVRYRIQNWNRSCLWTGGPRNRAFRVQVGLLDVLSSSWKDRGTIRNRNESQVCVFDVLRS